MSTTQWLVECDPRDNESLARVLNEHCIGDKERLVGVLDTEGKPHDVWIIPSWLFTKLREAKRSGEGYKFRFWIRSTPNSPVRSAEFFEQRYRAISVRKAEELIAGLKRRKK